jgi:rhamnogalacturonan endolyase
MRHSRKLSRRDSLRGSKLTFAAAGVVAAGLMSANADRASAQVTLTKSGNNWTITDPTGGGTVAAVFSTTGEDITSIKLNGGSNLLGGSTPELDEETAGTPFGSGTETPNSQTGPNGSYVDVWTTVAGNTTTGNPLTYAFHYVLFANDPTVYCYETVSHAANAVATSLGQGQFLFRSNPSTFPNLYQAGTGPNNPNPQTTIGIPSTASNFSSVTGQAGRTVSNVTYDLTGSGIPGDNGTNFFTKYDYSVYSQMFQAETMYGSQYAVTEVVPSDETLTGGPTKQELAWTDPGILNMEFLSDHYGIDGTGTGTYPGYAVNFPAGDVASDFFGPYGFAISSVSTQSAAQINQNVINDIPNDINEFNEDNELIASGYVPAGSRGSVQINAGNVAGWSSNTTNNTVVLSEPGVNMQESTEGDQYWAQINPNGTANLNNVAPGTYRLTLYELGQWGETRVDGVVVKNGQITTPQNLAFVPENFGPSAPIWTIGTPDRSDHEFLNGQYTSGPNLGQDLRQYPGAYNFWQEELNMGTPGYVSYNATATTINGTAVAATNNTQDWIGIQWNTFDPGMYDASNGTSDEYNSLAPAYVNTGGGPATYRGLAWQVHFTVTPAQLAQGQYVELSVALGAQDASLVVALNGHSETWSYNNFSPDDPAERSGDAGFYQWGVFEFPTSDLNAAGVDDEFTFGVSNHTYGVMYDALRMEITNTSANPAVTGWYDYNYLTYTTSTTTQQDDALGLTANNEFAPIPEPTCLTLLAGSLAVPLLRRRRRRAAPPPRAAS